MEIRTLEPHFPDFSEYLAQGDNLAKEDEAWLREHEQPRKEIGSLVYAFCHNYDIKSVIEFGCGAGWVGQMLPDGVYYAGIDKNQGCGDLAASRNKRERSDYFIGDVRDFPVSEPFDLVVSFAFLKHFGLHEWKEVFQKFLSFGKYAIFTVQLTDGPDIEDGTEYHHVWIGPKTFEEAMIGQEVLHSEVRWQDPNSDKRDVLFVTRKQEP